MEKIVIIMPTYNEAGNIQKMIDELFKVQFPEIKSAEMHLLIVDDNSPDRTGEIVLKNINKYKNLHLLKGEKKGLGVAYVRGMRAAIEKLKADAVIEMDADFQHNPKYIKDFVMAFENGADYVIGSRYVKGGSVPKAWPTSRKAVSFFGNLFARIVLWRLKIHDLTTGFRLTRVKGVLEKINLEEIREQKRFAHKIDLLFKTTKLTNKIVEVPIDFETRKKEASKFSFKEMIASYKLVILIRIIESQRFIKFGTVGFVGYLVNAIMLQVLTNALFPEWSSWLISTELAIISNFTLNNIWTFRKEKIIGINKIISKFFQFNLSSVGALVIQTIFGTIGVKIFGSQARQILLPLIVVFLVLPYNYFMYNAFIWKTWKIPVITKLLNRKR